MAKEPDSNAPLPPPQAAGQAGEVRRLDALPPARDSERLAAALKRIQDDDRSIDEAAEEFGLDPEHLHRWSHRSSQGARPAAKRRNDDADSSTTSQALPQAGGPKRQRMDPSLLAEGQRQQFAQNWDTVAERTEHERELSMFEAALERFPPLDWFLGSDRRRLGTALLVGMLLVSVIIYLAREKPAEPASTADPADAPAAIVTLPGEDDHAEAIEAARGFLAAGTVEEKMRYVWQAERIRPLAEDWYSRPENRAALKPVEGTSLRNAIGIVLHGHRISVLELNADGRSIAIPVVLGPGGDAKVEWEATVSYCAVSWEKFAAGRQTEAVAFRVHCSPTDYYNVPFDNDKIFDAYRLVPPKVDPDVESRPLYGYARKGSVVAQYIFSLGRRTSGATNLILELRFPPEGFKDCVEIVAVKAESWINVSPQASK